MSKVIFLDSSIVGMVTNPKVTPNNLECRYWLESLQNKGYILIFPEIADYEIRRELLRARKIKGIKKLDQLKNIIRYLPLNTETMLKASQLWAEARNRRTPTATLQAQKHLMEMLS